VAKDATEHSVKVRSRPEVSLQLLLMVYPVHMVPGAGAMSVLAANDDEARASAARLAAETDATSEFGAAVRELFGGVAKGEHLIVLRPGQEVTPAGAADLLGVSRQFVDRLLADGVLEFRRLPDSKHRRIRVGDVLALAEERARRRQGAEAVRSALGQPAALR
jgi:excisionase family DNA binding protein